MAIAKVIELSSSSKKGFDDAVQKGIKEAGKTVKNIQGAWVNEQSVVVKDDEITEYRVNMKVTFLVKK